MGNFPACLSTKVVHQSNEEEVEATVRVLRTTDNELFQFPGPVFVRDLLFGFQGFAVFRGQVHPPPPSHFKKQLQPLHPDTELRFDHIYHLKPWIKPSSVSPLLTVDLKPSFSAPLVRKPLESSASLPDRHVSEDDDGGKPSSWQSGSAEDLAAKQTQLKKGPLDAMDVEERGKGKNAAACREAFPAQSQAHSPTKVKVVKKVRFAEDLSPIPGPSAPDSLPVAANERPHRSLATGESPNKEGQIMDASALLKKAILPYIVKEEVDGVVKLRVLISKKKLRELMSSTRSVSDKEAGDTFADKMVAPPLTPTLASL